MTRKHYAIISLMLAVILAVSTLSGCNSCIWTDNETIPQSDTQSATMMPGYVDDGTTAEITASETEDKTDKVFVPSGPFKDGDNSGYVNSNGNSNSLTEDATETGNEENTPEYKPHSTQATEIKPVVDGSTTIEEVTETKPVVDGSTAIEEVTETKPAVDGSTTMEETTDKGEETSGFTASEPEEEVTSAESTEASQNETEAKPSETTAVSDATDATEETTALEETPSTKPEYPVPGVPDDDIIGPLPPIDMDEFLDPEATVATVATAPTSADSSTAEDKTEATVSSEKAETTNAPYIPENPETEATTASKPPVTTEVLKPTAATEATNPTDISGRLEFSYYGSFTGEFVEDGTDEYVQNVAIIFVTNISESYLEYAVITFDIDGQVAAFTATGLAPGESVWVLEQNRLKVEKGAEFKYVDDVSSFKKYMSPAETGVKVTLGEGQLKARNTTGKDLNDVYVYYKQVHTDGNFLGGITYRVNIGNMKAGEEIDCVAMHSSPKNSKVVSVTYREEAN